MWIWQHDDGHNFSWDNDDLASLLRDVTQLQGRLLGNIDNLGSEQRLTSALDAGSGGFEGELSAKKYQSLAKVSKATATRHIVELLEKNCVVKLEGSGRSSKYDINWS